MLLKIRTNVYNLHSTAKLKSAGSKLFSCKNKQAYYSYIAMASENVKKSRNERVFSKLQR